MAYQRKNVCETCPLKSCSPGYPKNRQNNCDSCLSEGQEVELQSSIVSSPEDQHNFAQGKRKSVSHYRWVKRRSRPRLLVCSLTGATRRLFTTRKTESQRSQSSHAVQKFSRCERCGFDSGVTLRETLRTRTLWRLHEHRWLNQKLSHEWVAKRLAACIIKRSYGSDAGFRSESRNTDRVAKLFKG